MTSLLHTRAEKEKALFVLSKVFEAFLFHGLKPADISAIAQHFTWMKAQAEPLSVNAKLETFPATRTTRIVLDFSFAAEVKPFTKN